MGHRMVFVFVAALVARPAYAATWFLLDAPRDRCLSGAEGVKFSGIDEIVSPGAFADLVRKEGRTPTVQTQRDSSGTIIEADVADRKSVLSWFATMDLCLKAKAILEKSGELTRPDELH